MSDLNAYPLPIHIAKVLRWFVGGVCDVFVLIVVR